jgi:hypothetical protein
LPATTFLVAIAAGSARCASEMLDHLNDAPEFKKRCLSTPTTWCACHALNADARANIESRLFKKLQKTLTASS